MSEKYTDLTEEIWRADEGRTSLGSVSMVLDYLDRHPEQVPGRTITERELERAVSETRLASCGVHPRRFLTYLGITVVPDPEPTNAEKLADYVRQIGRTAMSAEECGKWLDEQGVRVVTESE